MYIPREEHPNPQWEREQWQNLNGLWEFEFDFGCSAEERRLWEKEQFDREILVPFCPESRLRLYRFYQRRSLPKKIYIERYRNSRQSDPSFWGGGL